MIKFLQFFFVLTLVADAKAGSVKDTIQFEANDAIRFAKFKDFYKFGEDWSANSDSTGKYWVVTAKRFYRSKKIIKNTNTMNYCSDAEGCRVESWRIITMDKYSGKVINRRRYTRISN